MIDLGQGDCLKLMKDNTIYNMDCLLGMQNIKENVIDLVLTSPPYNIIRPNLTDRGYDLYKDGMTNDEYSKWVCNIFNEFDRIIVKNGVVLWNMNYGSENTECMSLTIADIIKNTNFTLADIIVWKKQNATPNNMSKNKLTRIVEFVYVFCRKNEFFTFNTNKKELTQRATGQSIYENIFNFIIAKNNDFPTKLNKATYSTELCNKLLSIYAKENSLVLDPFIGTGTTAVSCIDNKLRFVGFEISKKQYEFAVNRVNQRTQNQMIFDTIDYSKKMEINK